jgi:hydrogenase maturation protease
MNRTGLKREVWAMTKEHKKILVAGIGNPLMGDDGLSEHVIAKLKLRTWPENVTLLNMGCSVLNHATELEQVDTLIIIDAIRAKTQPGTIHKVIPSGHLKSGFSDCTDTARDSHGFSILDAIELARLKKGKPTEVIIYGIEPFHCHPGIGLSPAISNSVSILERLVFDEIMGHL